MARRWVLFGSLVAVLACGADAWCDMPCEAARHMGPPYYSGAIVPTPREVEYRDAHTLLIDGPGGEWFYHLTIAYDGPARGLVERLVNQRLDAYKQQFPEVRETGKLGILYGIVLTVVDDERAKPYLKSFNAADKAEALKPQGYVLEVNEKGVLCVGRDNAGLANGLASLLQLIHVRDGKLVVQQASIRDWPTFLVRYTSEYHLPGTDFFDWMMLYKINGFAACYPGMQWEGLTDAKREGLKVIGEYIRTYQTIHFMAEFHIGGRRSRPVDCGNPAHVDRLVQTITDTMDLTPARHIMMCYDDVRPELQPEEKQQFKRPGEAHGFVMQKVYEAVKAKDRDTIVCFCPPYYQGRQHPRWNEKNPLLDETLAYMEDIRAWKNKDIRIVWTGPVTESRSITIEDIAHYQDLIGEGRPLFYWDNTWHYHQPLRNFHARYLDGFVDYCADRTSYINVNGVKPIGKFFAVTANDYYWNPEAFDPKRARRHGVAQFMGPQAVPAAEKFYDLRGEDYFVFFSRDVDLGALKGVVAKLDEASLDRDLAQHCSTVYNRIVEKRNRSEKRK